ncbi:hypothetical protein [Lysinibacillus sp. BPa_S21]|uniref:hypothetical protein n=1 Tax=Lysinibacillus sp. BPa_S21 TaxID=2932478 RepID=UPI0020135FE5|nr:hypothetical protein [Lysinibacillus sp. BPa_S21]MCL1698318.1 hypothetical protein [Lysinibacillus sp. BPa_S21]
MLTFEKFNEIYTEMLKELDAISTMQELSDFFFDKHFLFHMAIRKTYHVMSLYPDYSTSQELFKMGALAEYVKNKNNELMEVVKPSWKKEDVSSEETKKQDFKFVN